MGGYSVANNEDLLRLVETNEAMFVVRELFGIKMSFWFICFAFLEEFVLSQHFVIFNCQGYRDDRLINLLIWRTQMRNVTWRLEGAGKGKRIKRLNIYGGLFAWILATPYWCPALQNCTEAIHMWYAASTRRIWIARHHHFFFFPFDCEQPTTLLQLPWSVSWLCIKSTVY